MSGLLAALDLTDLGHDRFCGPAVPTTLRRTFGGQVAAQALAAAARTVPSEQAVHSLHAYFLLEADPLAAVELAVDRTRDGGSFCTRQVSAVQSGRTVFAMLASFHRGDPGPEHAEPAPVVVPADELPDVEPWPGFLTEWPDWDIRPVPDPHGTVQQLWLRHRGRLPDDPVVHDLGLAYLSDMTLLGVAHKHHRGGAPVQMASLDHGLWFLQPARIDEWLLYDQRSPAGGHGRGLTEGRLFDTSGRLVAYVVQQGLMRYLR